MGMLTCRVSDELMASLNEEARNRGKQRSAVIIEALVEHQRRGGAAVSNVVEEITRAKKPAARAKKAKPTIVESDPLTVALELAASGVEDVEIVAESPQYQRPRHDPATCRVRKCGMCAAAKL
jgi:predicted transcriptional regulator